MFILACIIPPRLATIKSAHHPFGLLHRKKKKKQPLSPDNIYNSTAEAFSALSRSSNPLFQRGRIATGSRDTGVFLSLYSLFFSLPSTQIYTHPFVLILSALSYRKKF